MRIAALILGIIGGIIGLVAAGVALAIGAIGSVAGAQGSDTVIGLGWAALGLSVVGIIGGALAMAKPGASALLMLIAGVGGFIAISLAYVVAGPLLIVGAVLAFVGRSRRTTTPGPLVSRDNVSISAGPP
jgi:hypothetical protein